MIFVTVGTHEQQFNRLVKAIDDFKAADAFDDEVVIQTGYSEYKPKYCTFSSFYPYQQMLKFVNEARIIITHGGPSSFIMPLQIGKIPIVVPRKKEFNEHVNDHQMDFCKLVAERQGNIIVVEDIQNLLDIIQNYNSLISKMPVGIKNNNEKFCSDFEKIVNEIFQNS